MAHTLIQRLTGIRTDQDTTRHEEAELRHQTHEHAVVDEDLQYRRFGGFHFGAEFFGWIVSVGIAVILAAIASAIGGAVTISHLNSTGPVSTYTATTVGIVGGIIFVVIMAIAYYAGGYVAGRMARFDGARQGFGTWLIGVIITVILSVIGVALGTRYNVLQHFSLPALPVTLGGISKGGAVTIIAALIASLITAILGGVVGEHYHHKVDAAGEVNRIPV